MSCVLPVGQAEGVAITTIEDLPNDGRLHRVQQAWLDTEVSQCGSCQPGMIMAVAALLRENPPPAGDAIAARISVLCRCCTYSRVLKAVRSMLSP
jgi:isoquinoline 1-oxidoreductase subunit alpha